MFSMPSTMASLALLRCPLAPPISRSFNCLASPNSVPNTANPELATTAPNGVGRGIMTKPTPTMVPPATATAPFLSILKGARTVGPLPPAFDSSPSLLVVSLPLLVSLADSFVSHSIFSYSSSSSPFFACCDGSLPLSLQLSLPLPLPLPLWSNFLTVFGSVLCSASALLLLRLSLVLSLVLSLSLSMLLMVSSSLVNSSLGKGGTVSFWSFSSRCWFCVVATVSFLVVIVSSLSLS
mmetsp:Transcript_4044/g.9077  ORF Transcript_4044/g.9077 Transcript_4044/m.9077 type:complete len:237 (+) Transcript_4044:246-956(+)